MDIAMAADQLIKEVQEALPGEDVHAQVCIQIAFSVTRKEKVFELRQEILKSELDVAIAVEGYLKYLGQKIAKNFRVALNKETPPDKRVVDISARLLKRRQK
jgi:hypothetical protein